MSQDGNLESPTSPTGDGRKSTGRPSAAGARPSAFGERASGTSSGGNMPRMSTMSGGRRSSGGSSGARRSFPHEMEGEGGIGAERGSMKMPFFPLGPEDEEMDYDRENCVCDENECVCVTPPNEEEEDQGKTEIVVDTSTDAYQLDEFMRAKSYFLQTSQKSGLNLYDHLSDVIRKFLDDRAPNNPVDYLEEVSMNIKRYRFGMKKQDPVQDAFYIPEQILKDAKRVMNYYKALARWNDEKKEIDGESGLFPGGSFQNLLRLQYYLEHVNIGLPRDEMFMLALGIKELSATRTQVTRIRFWGKIFGIQKNYYVVEAELKFGGTQQAADLWTPKDEEDAQKKLSEAANLNDVEKMLTAVETFGRAKDVVLDHNFLQAYSKTSGLPPEKQAEMLPKPVSFQVPGRSSEWAGEGEAEDMVEFEDPEARADALKWEGYQQELMENFPLVKEGVTGEVPQEAEGTGLNRRVFYVCNNLGDDWILLPPVTPAQINGSRRIRWFLTGDLNAKVRTVPPFPGKEGHYLRALIARITAGGMVSPKGYYRVRPAEGEMPGEDDDDELEPEDDEPPPFGYDAVNPVKKFRASMKALTNPNLSFWVHHSAYILPQGRNIWWNPNSAKPKSRSRGEDGSEMDDDDYEDEDDEDEEAEVSGKEVGPRLFQSVAEDKAGDGKSPWSLVTSSTVFPEFQVASVRSNVWSGSNVICTTKGKVSNIYLGDGLKFSPVTYAPHIVTPLQKEIRAGPELQETPDPTVEEEQSWLNKLALNDIADVEDKFVDNEEEEGGTGEDEEDETEYEY